MKKIILLMILSFVFGSCQNQNKGNQENQPKKSPIIQPMDHIQSIDYFIGKWQIYDKVMLTKSTSQKQTMALKPCHENSYWEFRKNKTEVLQTKVTAVKDCQSFVSTKLGKASCQNGILNYFVDDVHLSVKVQKIDENRFSVVQQEVISGKSVIIQTFYQRK